METMDNSLNRVYLISRALHWICAIFFVLLVISMPIMLDQANNSAERTEVYMIHQSIATLFFLLLMFRFFWFLFTKSSGTRIVFEYKWQFIMARINHSILYLMMITMPVTGLVSRVAAGKAVEIFNFQLIPATDMFLNKDIKFYTNETHSLLVNLFYVLIVFHILGAISHVFQQRLKAKK